MPTNTYVALDKVTVGTATPSITFTGISGAYTDLVLVANATPTTSGGIDLYLTVNGDTTSGLYSKTHLAGYASSAGSVRFSNQNRIATFWQVGPQNTQPFTVNYSLQNYANSSVFKTVLARAGAFQGSASEVNAFVGLWRNTNAITSVTLTASSGNFAVGSTFSLYGIAASSVGAKATGGTITSDSQYYYHTFLSSGTFTPSQSLTCDYLVVAGGGGAGGSAAGGGGAGGLRSTVTATGGGGSLESALSLTATGYTVTVGAGGAGGAAGGNNGVAGTNSVFSTITSTGGGRGGLFAAAGGNGGSGGGGGGNVGATSTGGTGTAGQGNDGGIGQGTGGTVGRAAGGGGGAGAVGSAATLTGGLGGPGGAGVATFISGSSVTYAGGGGGWGGTTGAAGGSGGGGTGATLSGNPTSGTANTGGGGGGGGADTTGGAGGSGIVIVRYLKA
jgi:hypothetical protein